MFLDSFFLRGLVIGFAIALPIGPMGILCVRRSLQHGAFTGWVTGLGIASADAIYGAVAGFGLTVISGFLLAHQMTLGTLGSIFLCYLGIHSFAIAPYEKKENCASIDHLHAYASGFLLTLSNPATILAFLAIFASLGIRSSSNYSTTILFIFGIFFGSMFWWTLLSAGVAFFRKQLTPSIVRWMNRIAGILLLFFGLAALWEIFFRSR